MIQLRLLLALVGLFACARAVASVEPLRLSDRLSPPPAAVAQVAASDPLELPSVQLQIADQMSGRRRATLAVAHALSLIGSRYQFGGDGRSTFDCSALVGSAYRAVGLPLPRTSHELMQLGTGVERHALQPGDLLFFRWKRRQLHVAVYMGNGEIVHASPSERQVTRSPLTARWQQRLVGAKRLI